MSDSKPASASRAVFLSYASQDAEAATRICNALRAIGVEVWFDQNELVGGDQWDQKIKRQIRECALFLPVISASTNARLEGYFRREWKLAVERTQDMADEKAFLVPVVVDATSDAGASVPEKFRCVQWTRLNDGYVPVAFCAHVKELLSGSSPPPVARGDVSAPEPSALLPRRGPKSIAVLPFENLSEAKDDNGFFADGMHDDVINNLFLIRELRPVPRATAMTYRGTKKLPQEIAVGLGVAYLLTGTVRRTGDKVRLTATLLNPRTDEALWNKSYDKNLTDIFAIQSELAQAIAAELQLVLSPQERRQLGQRPTDSSEAYDLFLKARGILNGLNHLAHLTEMGSLLEEAVQLDPKFVSAWVDLGTVEGILYNGPDPTAARLAKARHATDNVIHLAPDTPEAIAALGTFYYRCDRDYVRAAQQWEKFIRLQPNNPLGHHSMALVNRRFGRWQEALDSFHRAEQLDPGDVRNLEDLRDTLQAGRRYDEAIVVQRRIFACAPRDDDSERHLVMAYLRFLASGDETDFESCLNRVSADRQHLPANLARRVSWARVQGRVAEAIQLARMLDAGTDAIPRAIDLAAQGDLATARAALRDFDARLRRLSEAEPANHVVWTNRGETAALLGQREEALQCITKAAEIRPESADKQWGPPISAALAWVNAWTNEKDQAIAEYARLLRTMNSGLNIYEMRRHPRYTPLRGDPRFEALLNDPRNNAPLF